MTMCVVCGRSKSQSVERLQSHRNPKLSLPCAESMRGRVHPRATV